ncbi:hypothetical protein Q1695_012969 [Nippostrongylus brasiliensis]|nr:hypothetical protein Q1695_012969 [Nippostrongylus brasiliensis]
MVANLHKWFVILILFTVALVGYYSVVIRYSGSVFQDNYVPVRLDISVKSVFDTCPLFIPDHLAPELRQFHFPGYDPKEGCIPYKPYTILRNGSFSVTEKADGYDCYASYVCLHNDQDIAYKAEPWVKIPSKDAFKCDIIETECRNGVFFGDQQSHMHMQIYEKCTRSAPSNERPTDDRPHFYVVVLDSVSSSMIKRSLPRTLKYLEARLNAVQMEFLNKVGFNSRPNAFPMAFGKSVEGGSRAAVGFPPLKSDWDDQQKCNEYLDDYSFFLEEYRLDGYKTMAAIDRDTSIVFYRDCWGLKRTEADHIWRPYQIRLDESQALRSSHNCSEGHLELLQYLEMFMNSYLGSPKAATVWAVNLAHDTLKDLYHADEHFLDFFERNAHHFDDAFFFFFGDHGPRFEGILDVPLGRYETNNPFLLMSVPKRYRNAAVLEQLQNKSHQLVTPFDVHATFMDILKLQPSSNYTNTTFHKMEPLSKGSSLLREWRGPRNCRTLPIPSEYCLCQYNRTIVKSVALLRRIGEFLAEKVNNILEKAGLGAMCEKLNYLLTLNATKVADGNVSLYEVAVYLTPSYGLFLAHVRQSGTGFSLNSGITRLNPYGSQGHCIPNRFLRPICLCKSWRLR